jgi:hypothetical protein
MPRRTRHLVALSVLSALVGCTTRPIPMAAQAGSTFVLPLARDSWQFALGYESEVTRQVGRHDDQRGALLFVLIEPSTNREHPLETRWVTRAWPDPASPAGIANALSQPIGFMTSQVLALIDIPVDTPPGDYALEVRRQRRTSPDGSTPPDDLGGVFDLLVPPTDLGTFRVLPWPGEPTPSSGMFGSLTDMDATEIMAELVPYPKLLLSFALKPSPAAGRVVVAYPSDKVEILSAFENDSLGRGSVVRWSADPEAGVATLDFVDPDRAFYTLALAFRLIDPFGVGRADIDDFQIASARLYDEAGLEIGLPQHLAISEIR